MSHSWHDDREGKWAALEPWAVNIKEKRGASPLLWLDVACTAPEDKEALKLLPLLVSGCQSFLVLAGPSYAGRLWCVIELFCFLKNGGEIDFVTVLPVLAREVVAAGGARKLVPGGMRLWALQSQLECFDVADAQCSKEQDTRRLLGCIEAGMGTPEAFNQVVRRIFANRFDTKVEGVAAEVPSAEELEAEAEGGASVNAANLQGVATDLANE